MDNSSQFYDLFTTMLPNITTFAPHSVTFSWYDYILFSVMLLASAIIGIYFGCFGSKQSTANEYLMGDKEMKVIPIAVSLVASHTSGITLLALPADVYLYGATYWLGSISMVLLIFITIYVFLPVFYNLQITSTYEYLERRFNNRTRMCASFLFGLSLFVYLPIVIYIPALAFSAATGINVHYITPVVCGVCIFYTTIGGLKALVWSDTLQFTVTSIAIGVVFVLGTKSAGGFAAVWSKAVEGQRLDVFDFDIDPTKRGTFWTIVVGLTIHWVAHTSINQGCVQKFLALPTYKDAKKSVIYYCLGMVVVKTISVLTGIIMFKKYSDCDPLSSKQIEKKDQLLPYYVMDVAGNIPGLPGLFIAGVFCAALSTLSANLNCLAGTIYEDFISKWLKLEKNSNSAGYILKIIVVITGIISTSMVYVVEHLGGLLQLAIGLGSVAHGPLLGMFTLGILFPKANEKGAFWGAMASLSFMTMVISGNTYYQTMGIFEYPAKPVSLEGCSFLVNQTTSFSDNFANSTITAADVIQPMFLFRLSFYWYTLTGALVALIVGLPISFFTNSKDAKPIDRSLLSPAIHFLLPKEDDVRIEDELEYFSVEKALKTVIINREREDGL